MLFIDFINITFFSNNIKSFKLDFFKWDSDNYKRAFLISGNLEYYADYDLSLHQEPFKWEIQKNVF